MQAHSFSHTNTVALGEPTQGNMSLDPGKTFKEEQTVFMGQEQGARKQWDRPLKKLERCPEEHPAKESGFYHVGLVSSLRDAKPPCGIKFVLPNDQF